MVKRVFDGGGFQYDLPELSNVSPANGPIIGGYQVSIWERTLNRASVCFWYTRCSASCGGIECLITALVPAGAATLVNVSVEDVYGV